MMRGCLVAVMSLFCAAAVLSPFATARRVLAAAQQQQVTALVLSGNIRNGAPNQPYLSQLQATGGGVPYAFEPVGNLPQGLAWTVTGNVLSLSGTPHTEGTYALRVSVVDATGQKVTQSFTLTTSQFSPHDSVNPQSVTDNESLTTTDSVSVVFPVLVQVAEPIHIGDTPSSPQPALVNVEESLKILDVTSVSQAAIVNVAEPLKVSDAESFPQPALVNVAESLHISDAEQAAVSYPPIGVQASPAVATTGTVGVAFPSINFSVTGGSGKATLSHSGTVPPGMTLSTAGAFGSLSGTPIHPGTFTFTVGATDDNLGTTGSQTYSVTIILAHQTIEASTFPIGTVGVPYGIVDFQLVNSPAGYSLTFTGTIPPGLSVEEFQIDGFQRDVEFYGTPTAAGTYPISFIVTDPYGNIDTRTIAVIILPAPVVTFTGSTTPAAPVYTDLVTIGLTAAGNDSAVPTGNIVATFDGGAPATWNILNGVATINVGRQAPGSHTLSYTYSGDSQYPAITVAQTYTFTVSYPPYTLTGTAVAVGPSLYGAAYNAIDANDNVYVTQYQPNFNYTPFNNVLKYDTNGNLTTIDSTSFNQPHGLAVDKSGNLYVADFGNHRVVELAPSGTQTVLPNLKIGRPTAMALDTTQQNLWIVDTDNYQVLQYNLSSQTVTATATGFGLPPISVLVAANGTAYMGTTSSYGNGTLYTYTPGPGAALVPLSTPGIAQFGGLAFDKAGNLYIDDGYNAILYSRDAQGNLYELASQIAGPLVFNSHGTLYTLGNQIIAFTPGPAGFGGNAEALLGGYGGTFDGSFRAYFHSPAGVTLSSLTSPTTSAYQSSYYFTASGSFAYADIGRGPVYPGLQTGSVTATFSDGTTLTSAFYGTANNALLGFSPGNVSQVTTNVSRYGGATTDQTGVVYVSDSAANKVFKIVNGAAVPVAFSGLNTPTQLGVDGTGAVYVLDFGSQRILKLDRSGTQSVAFDLGTQSALTSLQSFVLDGATGLWVAGSNNTGTASIDVLSAMSQYTQFATGITLPTTLGFDPAGNLYSGDASGTITKFDTRGKSILFASGLPAISSIAIEPSGTVYVADNSSATLTQISPTGVASPYSIAGVNVASVLAIDKTGSLTVGDNSTHLLNLDDRSSLAFTFGNVMVGATSPPQTATLSNVGNSGGNDAGLTFISLPGDGYYHQDAGTTTCNVATTSMAPGGSCTLGMTFTPIAIQPFPDRLSLSTNVSAQNSGYTQFYVPFSGTGVAPQPTAMLTPSSLSFGSVMMGSSPSKVVTLTNSGVGLLHLSSVALSGDANFSQTSTCGATLAANTSCMVTVTYAPTLAGNNSATLTFSDDSSTGVTQTVALTGFAAVVSATLTPGIYDFGDVYVTLGGTEAFILTNTGTGALNISSVQLAASVAFIYTYTNSCGTSLAAGASCTLSVSFLPTTTGARSATLTIQDDAGTQTSTITGTGVSPVAIVPRNYDFGSVPVGVSASQVFILSNNSGVAYTNIAMQLGSAAGNDYTDTTTCGTTLAANSSCSITVTYTPSKVGATTASITVQDAAGFQSASITGTGKNSTVFISSPHQMKAVSPNGTTTTAMGGGIGVVVDSSGSVLSIDTSGSSVSKFLDTGSLISTESGGGMNNATALAIDGLSNTWIANGDGTLTLLNSSGVPVSATTIGSAGNMSQPTSINIDSAGSVWVSNAGNNTVTEIVGVAAPSPVIVNAVINATPGTRP
jgi:sugar lactone lactonase YvrE